MKIIISLISIMFLFSCSSLKEHHLDCKSEPKDVLHNITGTLVKNGFTIEKSDVNIGYINALCPPTSFNGAFRWEIYISPDNSNPLDVKYLFFATCNRGTKEFPAYCGDDTDLKHKEYWEVRNKLETLCQNKFTIKIK